MVQNQATKLEALNLLKDHPKLNYMSKKQQSFRKKLGFPQIARSPEPVTRSNKILEELQTESSNSSQTQSQREEFLPKSTQQNKAIFKVLSPERRKDDLKTKTIKVFSHLILYRRLRIVGIHQGNPSFPKEATKICFLKQWEQGRIPV
jgi:hypothetical protein